MNKSKNMKYFKLLLVLIFINTFLVCKAQIHDARQGKVKIIQDNRIDTLIEKHFFLNKKFQYIEGWRIQIFFDSGNNSKKKAIETAHKFLQKYKGINAYISFKEPYYKVRVGDFRTRMDAQGFLKKIIYDYPNAIYVKEDKINFPKLN